MKMKKEIMCISILLFLLLLYFRVDVSRANIIYVDANGGKDFTRIQDAIAAANNGDTIFIYNGIYYENLIIDKRVTLLGEGRDSVIIDGGGSGNVIIVRINGVEISEVSIRNGGPGSAGILLDNADYVTISHCKIEGTYYGIVLSSSSYNTIRENIISNSGNIGIHIDAYSHDNSVYHNNFINNGVHAFDNGYSNMWYNEELREGNYWDDYQGSDSDKDGIGDDPYPIEPATEINKDLYPLIQEYIGIGILHLQAIPQIQVPNKSVNISCRIVSNVNIKTAYVNITFPNGSYLQHNLTKLGNTSYYYFNHSYSLKGEYYYYVYAEDIGNSSITSDTKKFVIAYAPHVYFSYSPLQPTDLDTVNFVSNSYDSDGSIINYTWSIYDPILKKAIAKFYTSSFSYRFPDNGDYEVSLTVVDNDGAWNTTTKTIEIQNIPPVANFSWELLPPYYGKPYVGQQIKFYSQSYDRDGEIRIYKWNFGDGNVVVTGSNYTIYSYSKNGVFSVSLTVTDNDYGEASITKSITIYDIFPPSIENLTAYPNPQEAGSSINISCSIHDDVAVAYAWLIVSTPNGSIINVTMNFTGNEYFYKFVFSDPGNYSYHVLTSDVNGNKNSSSQQYFNIIVPPSPPSITNVSVAPDWQVEYGSDANISCLVIDNVGVASVVIELNGNKTMHGITDAMGNGLYYYVLEFPSIGSYTFKIYATDVNGYANSTSYFEFTVADTMPPSIEQISYKKYMLQGWQNISCNIYDPSDVYEARINVTMADGSYINESMTKGSNYYYNFSCNATGIYYFYIWTNDTIGNSGRSKLYNFSVTIPPVANFTWQPLQPYANEAVTFDASMSYDIDGSIVNYTWDFVDGSTGYGCIVNHSYSSGGIYNVTLIVKDDDGASATIEKQMSVASNLPPSIVITNPANGSIVSGIVLIKVNASDDVGIVKVEIRIDGNAWINLTGTTTWQYEWNTTLYENGLHVIEARCYDGFFYAYASISVNVSNQIDFYYEPSNPLSGQPVYFYAPAGNNYTWDFGDGSIAYGRNVSHVFPIGNYYNVTLVVNKNGINMTSCKTIRVDTLVTLVKNANNVVNFISWSAPYSIKASELASLIGEPMQKGSVISKWNTSKGSYDDYIVGVSPSQYDFVISPGDAIVLRVSSPGSFVMPEVIK